MNTAGQRVSISAALNGHRNSLGLIRLVLASVVIVDHAFPLSGYAENPFHAITREQATLGSLAVGGFFAISGYLITKSGMNADVLQYLWRRVLRIFPAYWLVLLVTAFVIAPVLWVIGGGELAPYFQGTPPGATPYFYITGNWTLRIHTYGIYDLLVSTTPYGQAVHSSAFNGSLWTLIYEWQSYLIIAALVLFGVLKKARIVVPLLAGYFFVLLVGMGLNPDYARQMAPSFLRDENMIVLGFTFMLGAVIAVYSDRIPFDDWLGVGSGLLLVATLRYGGFGTLGTIAGAYFVLYLAARLPQRLHWIGQKNDYSYGVYIYGFLAQQVLAFFGAYKLGLVPYIGLSWIAAFGCAWLSWHLLEKRALALKDWGPGRGVRHWWERFQTRIGRRPNAAA